MVRPLSTKKCSIPNCGQKSQARGYCNKHYQKYRKLGDPLAHMPRRPTSKWLKDNYTYDSDECLIWPFSLLPNGYGQCFNYFGVGKGAHRNMCFMAHGKPPTPKHEAAHSCKQNRACVNPKHLSWKTASDNRGDKVRHGTHMRGERCHLTKLTETKVLHIRRMRGKISNRAIGERFGVTEGCIKNIQLRRSWAWL